MSFIKELWTDPIIQNLYEDQDLRTLFNRDMEDYVRANGGNVVNLPLADADGSFTRTDNLTVGSGLPLSIADTSESDTSLTIYEYTYGPKNFRKIKDIQSNDKLLNLHVAAIVSSAKEFMFQEAMKNIINNVHADHKKPWTGASGASFSYDDLAEMNTLLGTAKIPETNRFAAMPHAAGSNLRSDDYLKNWLAINQQAIQDGKLPGLEGFGIKQSTLVAKTTGAGAIDATPANNTKLNVVGWNSRYMHLIVQTEMEVTGGERAEYLGEVLAFTIRFGLLLEKSKAAVQKYQA